jgi:hypothetical protein
MDEKGDESLNYSDEEHEEDEEDEENEELEEDEDDEEDGEISVHWSSIHTRVKLNREKLVGVWTTMRH